MTSIQKQNDVERKRRKSESELCQECGDVCAQQHHFADECESNTAWKRVPCESRICCITANAYSLAPSNRKILKPSMKHSCEGVIVTKNIISLFPKIYPSKTRVFINKNNIVVEVCVRRDMC